MTNYFLHANRDHRGYNISGFVGSFGRSVANVSRNGETVMVLMAEGSEADVTPETMVDRAVLAIDAALFPVYYQGGYR